MNRILGTFAAAVLFAASAAFAAAPGKVTIPAPAAGKQGAVNFDHAGKTHAAQKCTACHADDKGGKIAGLDMKKGHETCQKCHNETAKADATKAALKACTNCHAKKG
ncbi:MAG: cytochrome C [Deltaproteobacteria bacterium]|nr:cytochrome C [Deltaproteobacteria bacterium]